MAPRRNHAKGFQGVCQLTDEPSCWRAATLALQVADPAFEAAWLHQNGKRLR